MMLSWKLNKITHSPVNTRILINGNYICAEALASLSDYDILRQSQNTLAPYTCVIGKTVLRLIITQLSLII